MDAEPFLRLVARAFLSNAKDEMKDYCFVFPNRRSGVFWSEELAELASGPMIMPEITSISDFLCSLTGDTECNRVELLLDLYLEYKNILGDGAESFDRFAYWGEIVLNDFNDVDRYLVNANSLFRNVKEYREIKTDFLTDLQREVIREYFGDGYNFVKGASDKFWEHIGEENTDINDPIQKYIKLWEVLASLYERLNKRLESKGLSYSGRIYRKAADIIKSRPIEAFEYRKYIFVGFNVLSTSEFEIFRGLKSKGIADFYWDCNSPVFKDYPMNKASRFIKNNLKNFPSQLEINEPEITTFPSRLKAIAVPSNIGQVKYGVQIIKKLEQEGEIADKNNMVDTAVVLPDETLFIPLMEAMPDGIDKINVTMGLPVRNSSIATLIALIARMHRQAQKIKGEYCYYHEDVKSVLSHPYIKIISAYETQILLQRILKENLYFVPMSIINECVGDLSLIFQIEESAQKVNTLIAYFQRLIDFIEAELKPALDLAHNTVELGFIDKYINLFSLMEELIAHYESIEMTDATFFFLISKFISSATISFEGEPLEGLQIMGILETRCLDFKNLIVLSMNERVFPKKHFTPSFIPDNLRKAFGLATMEYQECIYAYYFYRMISRAQNVYLLYDARIIGVGSGEPSRYINQLDVLYPQSGIKKGYTSFSILAPQEIQIAVEKTGRIMKILDRYKNLDGDKALYLSASAINQYINCPLQFYFEKIERLYIEDEVSEFIDYSTFGTIIHSIMEHLYKIDGKDGARIGKMYIEGLLHNSKAIENIIRENLNKIYYKKQGDGLSDDLAGEGYILKDIILHYIYEMLNYDKETDFIFIQGEKEEKGSWKLDEGMSFNFKQYIDRVDIDSSGKLRIIDYKTGGDNTKLDKIENLFDGARAPQKRKAILQVFLYCNFYSIYNNKREPIKPLIYTCQDMSKAVINMNKEDVENYQDYNDDFLSCLKTLISGMFSPNIPFTQAKNAEICKYCKFVSFCRK